MSLGIIGGYQNYAKPHFSMIKIGGSIKCFFVDDNNVYTYIDIIDGFSLNKEQFKNGGGVRIGIGFPIMKRDMFNININGFYEVNSLTLEGGTPLFDTEIPQSIVFRDFGLSLGVKF